MKFIKYTVAASILGLSASAQAGVVNLDDFNDGVVSGWTTQAGSISESGGVMSGSNSSLATLDGATSSTVGVDAIASTGTSYTALVMNYSSVNDNLFVKIQDNNGNGLFDRVFFYHGNNGGSALTGTYYFDLSNEVSSTYFELTDNGDGTVSAMVGATGDTFSGTLSNSYSGTGIGLGFYGNAQADNFYAVSAVSAVPEPSTYALMLGGLGLVGFMAARRRKQA